MSVYPPVRNELARLLSQARLAPYKQAVPGAKLDGALELYVWNLAIAMAMFESIHYFEVGLRNTMHEALEAWATQLGATDPWYRDPVVPLDKGSRSKIQQAIKRATDDGALPEVPGGVVAELTFGFWWSLLAASYNRTLWQQCFRLTFPNMRRQRLHDSLDRIRVLRNRIAHHEPIHTRPLLADYIALLETAERVSPRLSWWIDNTSRVATVLKQRP